MEEKGMKYDQEKVRMDLLPPIALEGIAQVLTFGAKKYAAHNWSKGIEYSRLYGALLRHMNAWYTGEENDPESGLSHLHHAGCCLMFLIDMQVLHPELDDRPKAYLQAVEEQVKKAHGS